LSRIIQSAEVRVGEKAVEISMEDVSIEVPPSTFFGIFAKKSIEPNLSDMQFAFE